MNDENLCDDDLCVHDAINVTAPEFLCVCLWVFCNIPELLLSVDDIARTKFAG